MAIMRAVLSALLAIALAFQQLGASRTALVSVADQRVRAIVDIELDDFVVREAGQPREVLSVRVADYPIAVILDNGPGTGTDFGPMREAAARFIGRVGHRPIAVAASSSSKLVATFDDERAAVLDAVNKTMPNSSGDGLFDAVVKAAQAISESGSPFSAIVVLSRDPDATVSREL